MSLRSSLESMIDESFSSKCNAGRNAFNDVYHYLASLGRDELSAMDAALYICISVFKADYDYSDTELRFMGEISGNTASIYTRSKWVNQIIPEIRSSQYVARRLTELESAPLNVKRSAVLLAALASICDRDLSYSETSEVQGWMNRLHVYFNN